MRKVEAALDEQRVVPLFDAIDSLATIGSVTPQNVSDLKRLISDTADRWRTNQEWGDRGCGYRAQGALLRDLHLDAESGYAQTDEKAEQLALSIFSYTLEGPIKIYDIINGELYTRETREQGGQISDSLRACLPFIKLLDEALHKLPPEFVFTGRASRAEKHVFPGYPGCVGGSQVHDPASHFPRGSIDVSYAFKSYSSEMRVMQNFAGDRGAATIFDAELIRAYKISKLSYFGDRESEVLLPLISQFEVEDVQKRCIPDEEQWPGESDWVDGSPYPENYRRSLGPDHIRLKQLPNARMRVAGLEIQRERIRVGEQIASGAFKIVSKGEAANGRRRGGRRRSQDAVGVLRSGGVHPREAERRSDRLPRQGARRSQGRADHRH